MKRRYHKDKPHKKSGTRGNIRTRTISLSIDLDDYMRSRKDINWSQVMEAYLLVFVDELQTKGEP